MGQVTTALAMRSHVPACLCHSTAGLPARVAVSPGLTVSRLFCGPGLPGLSDELDVLPGALVDLAHGLRIRADSACCIAPAYSACIFMHIQLRRSSTSRTACIFMHIQPAYSFMHIQPAYSFMHIQLRRSSTSRTACRGDAEATARELVQSDGTRANSERRHRS